MRQSVTPMKDSGTMPRLPLVWRVGVGVVVVLLLILGFLGYFMPGLRLNWETIAALCGF